MEGADGSKEQTSFWQFSDQLRLETTTNLSNLSLGDSIWGDSSTAKRADDRRNFDGPVSAQSSDFGWKLGLGLPQKLAFRTNTTTPTPTPTTDADRYGYRYNHNHNHNRNRNRNRNHNHHNLNLNLNLNLNTDTDTDTDTDSSGTYNSSKKGFGDAGNGIKNWNCYNNNSNYSSGEIKNCYFNKHGNGGSKNGTWDNNDGVGGSGKKKNSNGKNSSSGNGNNGAVDKRFKTLPPSEALPRNEAVGGYIFVCNNETMEENLRRQLFGLPPRYKDSVRAITPGLPLFLYNYSTHQLHGIFEATSFGGTNIDPIAWEDRKCPGESRFPAQVRVMTRKLCEPLEEDAFRPILHHYDGPKFRLELNVQEALALLDVFSEQNV